jgi:hypothetical protein
MVGFGEEYKLPALTTVKPRAFGPPACSPAPIPTEVMENKIACLKYNISLRNTLVDSHTHTTIPYLNFLKKRKGLSIFTESYNKMAGDLKELPLHLP